MGQSLVNGLVTSSLLLLVSLSFWIIYSVVRFFHFSHAALISIGGYIALTLLDDLHAPILAGIVVAGLGGAVIGLLLDEVLYRPLEGRGGDPLVLLLASVGAYAILVNGLVLLYGAGSKFVHAADPLRASLELPIGRLTMLQASLIVAALVFLFALWWLFRYTPVGLWHRALHQNREHALALALPVALVRRSAVLLGSFVAAVSGAWLAMDVQVQQGLGFRPLILAVIAMVVGQRWGMGGVAAAAVGLGLLINVSAFLIGARWQDITAFAVLVTFVLLTTDYETITTGRT